jgi:hypothetical protein
MLRSVVVPAVLLLGLSASSASAGRIFGDIKMDSKPLPAGVAIRITAPAAGEAPKDAPKGEAKPKVALADSAVTDKFGSYKLTVKEEGKCTLTVVYEKQPLSIDVFSYKEATRYDLILEKKDGKLVLRRKWNRAHGTTPSRLSTRTSGTSWRSCCTRWAAC